MISQNYNSVSERISGIHSIGLKIKFEEAKLPINGGMTSSMTVMKCYFFLIPKDLR